MFCTRCGAPLSEVGSVCPRSVPRDAQAAPAAASAERGSPPEAFVPPGTFAPAPTAPAAQPPPSAAKPGADAEEPHRPWWVPPFWQMPLWELERQLEEYGTMAWHRSYRKLSAILAVFVALVALALGAFGPPRPYTQSLGLVMISLVYLGMGVLVYRGNRGALVMLMILWTVERTSAIAMAFWNPLVWLASLAWWMFCMERFYRAWCVENARRAARRAGATRSA